MNLYYNSIRPGDVWQIPGQQDKHASRVEIPTTPVALCQWLNERRVPICLSLVDTSKSAAQAYGFDPTAPQEPVEAPPADNRPPALAMTPERLASFTASQIEEFILDVATVAQVCRIFEAIGSRFAEARR